MGQIWLNILMFWICGVLWEVIAYQIRGGRTQSFDSICSPAVFIELTATQLAQWDKHQSAEWEAVGSNPGRTNTQGL